MITVKKKVSLEFLGEDYKDGYLEFQSIPMKDYEALLAETQAVETEDPASSLKLVRDQVTKRFIAGKFPSDDGLVDIKKEELDELPGEVFVEAFKQLMGQTNPKD